MQGVEFPQMGTVVGIERDGQGPARAKADVPSARLLQLGRERRIARGGGDVETEQHLLAVVEFGDGGQHSGSDLGRAAARFGVDDRGGQAALRGPPGDHQADDAAPDDEDVGPVRTVRAHGRPAPPFAGMTRIRFVRSEAAQPPSQPGTPGLPRVMCTATLNLRPPPPAREWMPERGRRSGGRIMGTGVLTGRQVFKVDGWTSRPDQSRQSRGSAAAS